MDSSHGPHYLVAALQREHVPRASLAARIPASEYEGHLAPRVGLLLVFAEGSSHDVPSGLSDSRKSVEGRQVEFNYSWIIDRLAQGNYPGTAKRGFAEFDVIMLNAEEHQPRWKAPPGKYLFKLPLDDDPYQPVPLDVGQVIVEAAIAAGSYHVAGHKVITTCHQGHNRSGICTAIILMHYYGMSANDSINLIRRQRNDDCIGNPMFEQFVANWRAYKK